MIAILPIALCVAAAAAALAILVSSSLRALASCGGIRRDLHACAGNRSYLLRFEELERRRAPVHLRLVSDVRRPAASPGYALRAAA